MIASDVFEHIESWAPEKIAWDRDNTGLQVGAGNVKIKNILLALEVTPTVISQALQKKCNLIITHHPLLFHSLRKIDLQYDPVSKIIEKLLKNNLTLFSAHTNLDFTKEGVSFQLASKLKLQKVRFLVNLKQNQFKLAVFVPKHSVEKIAEAMFEAGGGIIGEYSSCSFRTNGTGSFKGSPRTSPSIGKREQKEFIDELKLEVLVDSWRLPSVIDAIKKVHPYEEVAYDVYPLENQNVNYGIGATGKLPKMMSEKEFLKFVSNSLKIRNFRYSGRKKKISNVAVCGGSGSDLIAEAIRNKADAFITADIKYHNFFDASDRMLLVDAGHYETEKFILDELKKRLTAISNNDFKVYKFSGSTNPVIFYNN